MLRLGFARRILVYRNNLFILFIYFVQKQMVREVKYCGKVENN